MEASDFTGHISRRFNRDIEDLRNSVLAMGGLVENQLSKAVSAIISGDSELGLRVANDDYMVNDLEVSIDEECGRILATRQPAASDLRLIVAIIKTITDLERIGDEAAKIARQAIRLCEENVSPTNYIEIRHIGAHVSTLLHKALDAFARLDLELAVQVVQEDSDVDKEYGSAMRSLVSEKLSCDVIPYLEPTRVSKYSAILSRCITKFSRSHSMRMKNSPFSLSTCWSR